MDKKQALIERYIRAYNAFDVEGMLAGLHPDITFRNLVNGEVTLELHGIEAFRKQAEEAKAYFREREQRITAIDASEADIISVSIDYQGILAVDLPNGLKAGDEMRLSGKSVFRFREGKIIGIEDLS